MKIQPIVPRVGRFLLRVTRHWLNFDWREALDSYRNATDFLRLKPSDKTVLMIEPNRYHAEVLPGYSHYFSRLGFKVVLLQRRENASSGVFDRISADERPLSFAMHPWMMRRVLKSMQPGHVAFVFLTSAYWAEAFGHFGLFCKFVGHCPEGSYGHAMVVHEFEHVLPNIEQEEVPLHSISQLSPNQYKGQNIPVINPHFFGAIATKPLGTERVFITVGTQYRNFQSLIESVLTLERQGYSNFKVQIVGGGAIRETYPEAPDRIEFLGRIPFPELYRRLEAADFYLCSLDPDNQKHQRYLVGTTTGARQLMLGFLKVPVMHERFASAYGFSDENAILYEQNRLVEGMQQALDLHAKEHERLKAGLSLLRDAIEAESLSNLSNQIYEQQLNRAKSDFIGIEMQPKPELQSTQQAYVESSMTSPDQHPLVSVVIPTYNRRGLLPNSIKSCLAQSCKNLEVIIVDDGSTDGTAELVEEMLGVSWPRDRVTYFRQQNQGASSARNHGLRLARGDYVQFLDSDDLLLPTKITKQALTLEEPHNSEAACCYCYGTMGVVTEEGTWAGSTRIGVRETNPDDLVRVLCSRVVHGMPTPAPLWRRSYLMEHAGWREDIALGDDLEYHIRLLVDAKKICFIDEELFLVREHSGPRLGANQMSASSLTSLIRSRMAIFKTLQQSDLWVAHTQRAFLGAMRTIYANALQLGERTTTRELETWLWSLSSSPKRIPEFQLLILTRRLLGRRFLLGAHKLISKSTSA